jgi:AraC-like DNA-binding protein
MAPESAVNPAANGVNWPTDLLRRKPVRQVYVCSHQLEPPVLSHVVNFPRLEVPLAGCYENQIEVDGKVATVELKPGTALFAPPNCWNLPTWKRPVRLLSLLFGKKQIGMSIVTARGPASPGLMAEKLSQPRPLTGPVPKILEAMLELAEWNGPAEALVELARALLTCLPMDLIRPAAPVVHPAKSLLEDVCVYLQGHYQYDISRDSVAREFRISPNYLSRVFQVQGHMTFSSYLMHVRTDRAKHLLRRYDLKLDDVAARCGYRDTAYFCRVFKKLAKITPAEYRAQEKSVSEPSHINGPGADMANGNSDG